LSLREVELTLRDKLDKAETNLTTDFAVKAINASRKTVRSILYNLISNAVKYKSPNRPLELLISTAMVEGCVQIYVKDNGIGIAEDKLDLIFTQFTRIGKNVEGTGIGLYLVKSMVDNSEGKIVVNSKLGKGSEFIVYLPVICE
jgi:two-component system phosphate regulon sensor histidine kinase PhoR